MSLKLWELCLKEVCEMIADQSYSTTKAVVDYRGYLVVSQDRATPISQAKEMYRQNMMHALSTGKSIPQGVIEAEQELILELCSTHNLPVPHQLTSKVEIEHEVVETYEAEVVSTPVTSSPLTLF